jgi:hypothetical protein
MALHQGPLRVELAFVNRREDGTDTALHLGTVSDLSVVVTRPDGTEFTGGTLTVTNEAGGLARWDGDVDARGTWMAQGFADDVPSDPVYWRVE